MTRARDFLYLSCFSRISNRVTPSPFLLEVAGADLGELDQLPLPTIPEPTGEEEETPTIPFSDLAAYERCPYAFRLQMLMGFQPPIVGEMGYGRAVHHILRRVAEETRRAGSIPDEGEMEALFAGEFYLPYANKPGYEKMLAAAHRLVGQYVSQNSDDLFRVWEIERPYELYLDGASVSGR